MQTNPTFEIYRRVLTIAGSDSGGGAGVQADLKTIAANRCYGSSVITALTAQNTRSVTAIHPVPADFVAAQIDAVLSDIGADAVKIGMLFSAQIIAAVAGRLERYAPPHVVLDPVMVAQSGDTLLEEDAIAAVRDRLIPLADIVTPNLPEAEVLLGRRIDTLSRMEAAARDLAAMGCPAVLVKGGHLARNRSTDILFERSPNRLTRFEAEPVDTVNNHGTGCTLSSAIAARLARGCDTRTAVERAKAYVTEAIRRGAAYRLGGGHGPVHHFFEYWS